MEGNHAENMKKHKELFDMTEGVDFDSERYVQMMKEQLIAQKADFIKLQSEMMGLLFFFLLWNIYPWFLLPITYFN